MAEIAGRLGVDAEDVVEALQARFAKRSDSLDGPKHFDEESGATVGDHIPVHELGFSQAEHRADQEIGNHLGISQMQVWRIVRSSLQRLRTHAEQRQQLTRKAA